MVLFNVKINDSLYDVNRLNFRLGSIWKSPNFRYFPESENIKKRIYILYNS